MGAISRKKALRRGVRDEARASDDSSRGWFQDYRKVLLNQIEAIDAVAGQAQPDDREELRALRSKLEGKLALLAQEEEAVFTHGNLAINPPSQATIDRTKALATEMAELIRKQKRAEAIVDLARELADLAAKVGITP